MFSRREFLRTGAAALGSGFVPAAAWAQSGADIAVSDLGGIVLAQGSGCNVLALPGSDGALMIDGGLASNSAALLQAIYDATGNARIDTLINTHWHPEHTGANVAVGRDGGVIFAHEKTAMYQGNRVYSAVFDGALDPLPESARPSMTTRDNGVLEFDGMQLDYGYLPAAHTDGDLYIHFRQHDVLAAGDVVASERWPLIDYRNGAWFGGRVRALEWLADLVEADTRVVPAHGPVVAGQEVVRQRDICQALFLTMIEYLNRGFGPEDAAAENPLAAYESEFGDATEFVYGAYRSMLIAYVPD